MKAAERRKAKKIKDQEAKAEKARKEAAAAAAAAAAAEAASTSKTTTPQATRTCIQSLLDLPSPSHYDVASTSAAVSKKRGAAADRPNTAMRIPQQPPNDNGNGSTQLIVTATLVVRISAWRMCFSCHKSYTYALLNSATFSLVHS